MQRAAVGHQRRAHHVDAGQADVVARPVAGKVAPALDASAVDKAFADSGDGVLGPRSAGGRSHSLRSCAPASGQSRATSTPRRTAPGRPLGSSMKSNTAPTWRSAGVNALTNSSMESSSTSSGPHIAEAGECASSLDAFSAIKSQTSPWFERRLLLSLRSDAVTFCIFAARPSAYCTRGAGANSRDVCRQRPDSTHDTGMTIVLWAGISIVRLTTRFCLAPTSSSPSTMRTAVSPEILDLQLGHAPGLGHLRDLHPASCRRLIQRRVAGGAVLQRHEGQDAEAVVFGERTERHVLKRVEHDLCCAH